MLRLTNCIDVIVKNLNFTLLGCPPARGRLSWSSAGHPVRGPQPEPSPDGQVHPQVPGPPGAEGDHGLRGQPHEQRQAADSKEQEDEEG